MRRVLLRLPLRLGVDLRTEQDDVAREVEPQQQHHNARECAVGVAVLVTRVGGMHNRCRISVHRTCVLDLHAAPLKLDA